MAIFRCNKCAHIREVGSAYIGKSVKCPKCHQITPIYDTVTFLRAVIQKYTALKIKHLQQLKIKHLQQLSSEDGSANENEQLRLIDENTLFTEIDIHNTKYLTQPNNLEPIIQWFEQRKIQTNINPDAADTTGFFDEVALLMGSNFSVFDCVISQIKYIQNQNKDYENVKVELAKKNPQETRQIISFCKELHDYSFVARYSHKKKDKVIYITLQKSRQIKRFFNGIWMEWFTLMKLLEFFKEQKIAPSCTMGLNITFPEGNSNEIDLFCLTEKNVPICIECKSGEFRRDIDKYQSLRKKLNIDKNQFVLCVFGLSQEQTQGMTSMYDVTFVNEASLIPHIQTVI